MDNYENKLHELKIQKEKTDRFLLTLEWVISILSLIVLFIPIFISVYFPMEDRLRTILTFTGVIPAIIGMSFSIKIEQIAGYYECKHCGHRYVPTFKAINLSPHSGRTRYMRCPKCNQKSWQKKVIGEE